LSDSAARTLEAIFERFITLDTEHIDTVLAVCSELHRESFSGHIRELLLTVEILGTAVALATGVPKVAPKPGRPRSRYVEPAMELISLWQFMTAEQMQPPFNVNIWIAKPVPTAKKQVKRGEQDMEASQESTEFCRLAFRMIDPEIKLAQVRTAINNARKCQDQWSEFLESTKGARGKEGLLMRWTRFVQKQEGKKTEAVVAK
jgi:hypothetical protein